MLRIASELAMRGGELCRRNAADRAVRANLVVVAAPACDLLSCLTERLEPLLLARVSAARSRLLQRACVSSVSGRSGSLPIDWNDLAAPFVHAEAECQELARYVKRL